MTPKQCVAARRLLGWSQKDLAATVRVHVAQIGWFERIGRLSKAKSGVDRLAEIRAAFEGAGVEFFNPSSDETGVRLREEES